MSWTERTQGGRRRVHLIDPETQDWVVSEGRIQWDSTAATQVYHAVMTQIGSMPSAPGYGSRVHEAWKITTAFPRELESSLYASLDPLIVAGVIKSGSLTITVTPYKGDIATILVEYEDGGGQKQRLEIPAQPGILD